LLGETDVAGTAGASGFSAVELSLLAEQLANAVITNIEAIIFFMCFGLVRTVKVMMNFLFLCLSCQLYAVLFKIS
jgi:hypothetical protein